MPSRKGPNILGRTPDIVEKVVKAQPKAVVVLSDLGLSYGLTHAVPNTMVIHRDYAPGDDRHLRISPETQIDISMRQHNDQPNLWFYTTNEAGLGVDNLKWHVALATKSPVKLRWVGLNPAIGTYPDSLDGWAYAEPYLRELSNARSKFIFGLHEYAGALPNSGMPNFTNRIQNWDGSMLPAYHCGRFIYLDQFCKAKGFQTPRLILTEHGFDDTSDIKPWLNTLRVNAGYGNIRGWKTLLDQWTEWYRGKGWSPQRAYWEALQWLEKNAYANSPVEAQIFYCWGNNGDPAWLQFDLSKATEFVELWLKDAGVNVYPIQTPIPSPEPPVPSPAFVPFATYKIDVPGEFINLRDNHQIPSNIIGQIKENEQVVGLEEKRVGNEYWRKVRTAIGIEGWLSLQWSPNAQKFGVKFEIIGEKWFRIQSIAKVVVNIRQEPTASSAKLGAISPNQILETTGKGRQSATEGVWVEVRLLTGTRGWASCSFLEFVLK